MRLAVQLYDDLCSHALLRLHAHARIFSVKEMDALKHVEERQAATSLDGAVGGNALGLLSAMLLKQMRADFFAHTDAVIFDDDLQAVIGLKSPNTNRKRLGLALRMLDAVFDSGCKINGGTRLSRTSKSMSTKRADGRRHTGPA